MGIRSIDGYTDSLDALVVALCRDFERRERESASRRVEMEYKYLNTRMLEAACDIAGAEHGRRMIEEIGERIGYAKSEIAEPSEASYKRLKLATKIAIARRLYLMD